MSYKFADKGYMFVLTEYGFEQKAPRTAFCNKAGLNKVPLSWVDKNYVKQVKVEEEK